VHEEVAENVVDETKYAKDEEEEEDEEEKRLIKEFEEVFNGVEKNLMNGNALKPSQKSFEGELKKQFGVQGGEPLPPSVIDGIIKQGFDFSDNVKESLYAAADVYWASGMTPDEARAEARDEFEKWREAQRKAAELKRILEEKEKERKRKKEEEMRRLAEELKRAEGEKKRQMEMERERIRQRMRTPKYRCGWCGRPWGVCTFWGPVFHGYEYNR